MFRLSKHSILVMPLLLAACGGTTAAGSTSPSRPSASLRASAVASSAPSSGAPASASGNQGATAAGASAVAPSSAAPRASSASGNPSASALPPLNPPVKVKVSSVGASFEAGYFVALDKGYFKDEGLDVEEVPLTGGDPNTRFIMLVNNDLQFATTAPEPAFFNAASRGVDVRLIAPYTVGDNSNNSSSGIVARKELVDAGKLKSAKDLKGMRLGWSGAGGSTQFYLERILSTGGLTLNDVTSENLNFPDTLTALSGNKIDAGWEIEPFISTGKARGLTSLIAPLGDLKKGSVSVVLAMNSTFATQQPEVAKRFVYVWLKGMREAWRAFSKMDGNQDEVIASLIKHTTVKDPALYKSLATAGNVLGPGPVQNGELDQASLDEFQNYYLKVGSVKEKIDLSKVIDRSYSQAAVQRLGRLE